MYFVRRLWRGTNQPALRRAIPRSTLRSFLEQLESREVPALAFTSYDPATPLSTLTNALVAPGSGLTLVGSSFVGENGQAGTYTGLNFQDGTNSLTLPDGIILTSGSAVNALGPNNDPGATTFWGTPGDPDLDALVAPDVTYDANSLTLQFTADPAVTNTIQFQFVFGSEEFPEWVG